MPEWIEAARPTGLLDCAVDRGTSAGTAARPAGDLVGDMIVPLGGNRWRYRRGAKLREADDRAKRTRALARLFDEARERRDARAAELPCVEAAIERRT